jgi:glycosyltransferase involved in cell wall biosynthesis
MRILHMLAPAETGGLEQVVQTLVNGLSQRAHDVHVAAAFTPAAGDLSCHPFLAPLRETNTPLHIIRVNTRAYSQEHAEVRRLCQRLAPAIVHTHGYRSDLVHAAAARHEGVPTITTVHGFTGGGLRNRLYEYIQRRSFSSFDAVVAVSAPMCDRLIRAGVPPKRLHLIRNAGPAPPPLLSREEARQRLGLPLDGHQIGWIGRLSHEKGADVLLHALELIPDRRVGATFVGDGPQHTQLQSIARKQKLLDRVRFAGRITPAAALLRAFDLFVLCSRTEGTPIVLFEAMDALVPIVATRVGGVPDVIDNSSGVLIDQPNPVLLARAIINLLANPQRRRQLAQHAYARLHRHFSRGPWISAHEQLYFQVTSSRPVHV